MSEGLLVLCWLALAVTAVMGLGAAAIGSGYHPEKASSYLAFALVPIVPSAIVLLAVPWVKTRRMKSMVAAASVTVGIALMGFFGFRMMVDAGDVLLWSPPFLLGLGLVVLRAKLAGEASG